MKTLLLVLFPFFSFAQAIINPSFEGPPVAGEPPYPWGPSPSIGFSTPDTQPGWFRITTRASQGSTYISLVTRSTESPQGISIEAIQAKLLIPFVAGTEYNYSIDLAYSKECGNMDGDRFVSFGYPVKLIIYGGSDPDHKWEVLWTSPVIDHTNWKRYRFTFTPTQDHKYIHLEANYSGPDPHPGNILIDYIQIDDGSELVDPCTTVPPIESSPAPVELCEGMSATLDATSPDATYQWANGSTRPSIVVTTPGTYPVTVSNGCEMKTYEYIVEKKECKCEVTTPNVFTPNGDDLNPTFAVEGSVARYSIKIYNRWGDLVFQANDLGDQWNGNDHPTGIYYWTIDIQCIRNETILDNTYKGWVSLIR
jgi:gliding motility-associated-like protein